jgi:membrane protein DedA with SNARE-associated domain
MNLGKLVDWLVPFFANYGYLIIFAGVFLENSAGLGLVIPGETILILGSFFAARGSLNIVAVIVIAFVGAVLGDNLGYYIGRKGGRRLILKYGKYIFVNRHRLAHVDRYFKQHGGKTIFIARFTSFLRALAAMVAGSAKMPYRQFFFYDLAGAFIWSIVISLLGFFLGGKWDLIEKIIRRMGYAAFALIIIVIAGVYIFRWRQGRKKVGLDEDF